MTEVPMLGRTPPSRLSFSLPLEPSRLLRARHRIRDYLDSYGASPPVIDDVVLAIEEAMTNAVLHSRAQANLEVRLGFEGPHLRCEIRDYGVGFDVEQFDRSAVPGPLDLGGRGLHIIDQLVDTMELTSLGDGLTVRTLKREVLGSIAGDARLRETLEADALAPDLSYRSERQRALVEEIAEGFAALDWEYRFIYVNDFWFGMYKMTREEVLGTQLWELFPHTHDSELGRALLDAMECGTPDILEFESPSIGRTLEFRIYPTRVGLSYYVRDITERIRRERERDQLFRELRVAQAEEVARLERDRLARDLHDSVTQSLFAASMKAESLTVDGDELPDEVRQIAEDVLRLNRGALAQMRTMLLELRGDPLEEAPIRTLLRHLVEAAEGRTSAELALTVEGDEQLASDLHVAVYRVVQEALNNVARHAKASKAWVELEVRPDIVHLVVGDDGCGFEPRAVDAAHLGLRSMRERAAQIGAELRVDSAVGRGTVVTLERRAN